MSTIPTSVTEKEFNEHIYPHLSKAKRGYVSKIPMYKIFNYILYKLHTGCQWRNLPIGIQSEDRKKEITYSAIFHHYKRWSSDGSLEKLFKYSILWISEQGDLSSINLDGSHSYAKKGGEAVGYQGRKKGNTTNILPLTNQDGNILGITQVMAGNHNDLYDIKATLSCALSKLKKLGIAINGVFLNADKGFDSRATRKVCFNHKLIPNIPENKRKRKKVKRGRKRLFNQEVYKERFVIERSFAWLDKFRGLLVRFERKLDHFIGAHLIACAMVNLRHILAG